jgi:hypothetical protein
MWKDMVVVWFKHCISGHLSAETEENHEKPQSGQTASEPIFVPETSKTRMRADHSTTTVGRRRLDLPLVNRPKLLDVSPASFYNFKISGDGWGL